MPHREQTVGVSERMSGSMGQTKGSGPKGDASRAGSRVLVCPADGTGMFSSAAAAAQRQTRAHKARLAIGEGSHRSPPDLAARSASMPKSYSLGPCLSADGLAGEQSWSRSASSISRARVQRWIEAGIKPLLLLSGAVERRFDPSTLPYLTLQHHEKLASGSDPVYAGIHEVKSEKPNPESGIDWSTSGGKGWPRRAPGPASHRIVMTVLLPPSTGGRSGPHQHS